MKDQQLSRGRRRAGVMVAVMASSGVLAASAGWEAAHATTSRSSSPVGSKPTSNKHVIKQVVRSGVDDAAFGDWEDTNESYLHELAQSHSHFMVQLRSGDGRTYTVTGGHKDGNRVITVADGTAGQSGGQNTMSLPTFEGWLASSRENSISMRESHTPRVLPATAPAALEGRAKEIYDYLNNPDSPAATNPNAAKLNGLAASYAPTQAKIFNYLIGHPGKTSSEITEGARVSKRTVLSILPTMVARGLIVRVKNYVHQAKYQYSVVETLPVLEYSR